MIGGEFEIDLTRQGVFIPDPETYYYASGRTALFQILRSIESEYKALWMPDWLCHTMVEAVEKAGLEAHYYELNINFSATVEALDHSGFKDGDAMLMVNYFGLQDLLLTSKAIKEAYPHSVVIEDDVQAYWYFAETDNPYADYRFTSMRKSFAIPDGGLVRTNHQMPEAHHPNTFAPLKLRGGVMKSLRGKEGIRDEDYLSLFKQGDVLIRENYNSCMSNESKRLFAGTDFEQAKRQRQLNAKYIVEGLAVLGIKPMIDVFWGSVPLFIPIYLDNRDEVRSRMFNNGVFCPVHWPLVNMKLNRGAKMAKHELSLIVDQRYNKNDMDLILCLIKE